MRKEVEQQRRHKVRFQTRKWLIAGSALILLLTAAGFIWASVRLKPLLRERLITAIREQYQCEVELADLRLSVWPFSAEGVDLVLRQKNRPGLPPLAEVKRLRVEASLRGMLSELLHLERVTLVGLQIHVPPKKLDQNKPDSQPKRELPRFIVNEVIADGTLLEILPKKEGKEPLTFDISKLTLHSAGTIAPMRFRATLRNPTPPGDIESTGEFGPWRNDEPNLTPVSGSYTFQNADLSAFKGIAGILSSEGKYQGQLGRIEVDGLTDTPDFTVRTGGHPVHLKTLFHAIVDGTDGDTYLEPINAQFGRSSLVAHGGVYGRPGVKGKTVSLDVTVSDSRIEDMLRLVVKGARPLMTGAIAFRTQFELPPGDQDVMDKLHLNGRFSLGAGRFTSFEVQKRVEQLSQRARGQVGSEAEDEKVVSNLRGRFALRNGVIRFERLAFVIPGASVELRGSYGLRGEELDFEGTLRTQAKVSQMMTGIKSIFLKLADPLFKKKDAGAVIPIKISGTREEPKFDLDLGRVVSGKK